MVEGNNTTNKIHNYEFIDENVNPEQTAYYRIKQVDNDGKAMYSDIISAKCSNDDIDENIFISNNPEDDNITIYFNTRLPQTITLIDNLGKTLINKQYNTNDNYNQVKISKSNLSSGLYNLILQWDNKVISKQIVIPR